MQCPMAVEELLAPQTPAREEPPTISTSACTVVDACQLNNARLSCLAPQGQGRAMLTPSMLTAGAQVGVSAANYRGRLYSKEHSSDTDLHLARRPLLLVQLQVAS